MPEVEPDVEPPPYVLSVVPDDEELVAPVVPELLVVPALPGAG
jgi:hypothetical protein